MAEPLKFVEGYDASLGVVFVCHPNGKIHQWRREETKLANTESSAPERNSWLAAEGPNPLWLGQAADKSSSLPRKRPPAEIKKDCSPFTLAFGSAANRF